MLQSKTSKINNKDGICFITFSNIEALGICRHGFSTRIGGISEGRYEKMNLSFKNGDKRENVETNYNRFCNALGIDASHLVLSAQTHTSNVISVDENDRLKGYSKESFCDVDGLVTNKKGVALVTQYADCTPLIFCDPKKKVIASSHAGWRGTVKKIAEKTVEKMVNEYDSNPKDIVVAIGPCICKDCYEVDDAVYNEFLSIEVATEKIFKTKGNGKYMLDLREANRQILIGAGIKEENIEICDICTNCNSAEMHSHRATKGERGNLAMIIELI